MKRSIRFVGLDVHKDSITIAVADAGRHPARSVATVPNEFSGLRKQLRKLGPASSLRCCYEAGPTGYGLYWQLNKLGIVCIVVAPSLVPKQGGQRVKTDRRDAAKLAHFYRSGDLTAVCVPEPQTEAIRDLTRSREDAKKAERAARHQLQKFLLRHGRRWEGKSSWTDKHLRWIARQQFEHEAQKRVLLDYFHTVEQATERVGHLTASVEELVHSSSLAPLIRAMQACRGVDLVVAATVAAELGDLTRFQTAGQLMAYLGLVPSEYSSGQSRRQGPITRTGNGHVRRVLVEAAWSYRFPARMSRRIKKRNEGVAVGVRQIAWKAQHRLCSKTRRLLVRGKPKNQVIVAVARELAGFLWAIAREPILLGES